MQRGLSSLLEAEGVKAFESVGQPFDPTRHEAMATVRDATACREPSSTRPAEATCGTTSSSAPPGCGSRNRGPAGHGLEVARLLRGAWSPSHRQRGRDQEGLSAARPQAPPGRQPGRQDGRRAIQGAERGQRRPVRPREARTLRPAGRDWKAGTDFTPPPRLAGGTSGGQGGRRAERSATSSRAFFGGRRGATGFSMAGDDIDVEIGLSLEAAHGGGRHTLQLQRADGPATIDVTMPAGVAGGHDRSPGRPG